MSERDRRALIILGVAVVLVGGFFFLTRGGGDEPDPGVATAPTPVQVSPSATPTPGPGGNPRTFDFLTGRNPFLPLVTEGTGGTTDPTDPGGNGNGGTPTPDPSISPAPPGAEEDEQTGITIGGHQVTLLDIFTDENGTEVVQVQVDGETFVVAEGETFADNFEVVTIGDTCATFLFGDQSFTLCEPGELK